MPEYRSLARAFIRCSVHMSDSSIAKWPLLHQTVWACDRSVILRTIVRKVQGVEDAQVRASYHWCQASGWPTCHEQIFRPSCGVFEPITIRRNYLQMSDMSTLYFFLASEAHMATASQALSLIWSDLCRLVNVILAHNNTIVFIWILSLVFILSFSPYGVYRYVAAPFVYRLHGSRGPVVGVEAPNSGRTIHLMPGISREVPVVGFSAASPVTPIPYAQRFAEGGCSTYQHAGQC